MGWIGVISIAIYLNVVVSLTVPPEIFEPNRIFVGGLTEECNPEQLKESFSQFGSIKNISIIGDTSTSKKKKRKPYAFVTFESSLSAEEAITWGGTGTSLLYKHVKRTNPIDPTQRMRSNLSRLKESNERERIMQICGNSNLILLVQSTHVDRLKDYVELKKNELPNLNIRLEGSSKAVTRNNSLLFLSSCAPTEIARVLMQYPILSRALKKAYVVDEGAVEANLRNYSDSMKVIQKITQKIAKEKLRDCFRLQIFPPSYQSQLLSTFDKMKDLSPKLDPKNYTDIISIVQIYKYKGRRREQEEDDNALVMTGISPSFSLPNKNEDLDEAVSRAYFKLKEAINKYPIDLDFFQGSIALDCGSAPGGWTKFLANDLKCSLVYSVDPGELQVDLGNVRHLKMKIQDAIPILKEKRETKVNIWVSDMCLHDMKEQVDLLLFAKQEGILEDNLFFVLTLKCNTGFSKSYFDSKSETVLKTLTSKARTNGTVMYHLFTNRSGERTIMGFLL